MDKNMIVNIVTIGGIALLVIMALLVAFGYIPGHNSSSQSTCTTQHPITTETTTATTTYTRTSNGTVIVQPAIVPSVVVVDSC